jgi:hypothetical protein
MAFRFIHSSQLNSIPSDALILGIEVPPTAKNVLDMCNLGNIDPQHTDGKLIGACQEVFERLSLRDAKICDIIDASQEGDVYLVTTRIDLDSVATMALMSLNENLDEMEDRIRCISDSDSFNCGDWSGFSKMHTVGNPWLVHGSVSDREKLAAVNWVTGWATPGCGNRITLSQAVKIVGVWLKHGELRGFRPPFTFDMALSYLSGEDTFESAVIGLLYYAYQEAYEARIDTIQKIKSGDIKIVDAYDYFCNLADTEYPNDLYDRAYGGDQRAMFLESMLRVSPGTIVITGLNGSKPAPASFAYCKAPVSIVEQIDPRSGFRRISIAAFNEKYLDTKKLASALSKIEPGWGGTNTMVGSPQNSATNLTLETVLEFLVDFLR